MLPGPNNGLYTNVLLAMTELVKRKTNGFEIMRRRSRKLFRLWEVFNGDYAAKTAIDLIARFPAGTSHNP